MAVIGFGTSLPLSPWALLVCLRDHSQDVGYIESRVLDLGVDTGYIVPFAVRTDLPAGIIISEWSFAAPWGHHISWDYDGFDMVPPNQKNLYARRFDSRLPAVLK